MEALRRWFDELTPRERRLVMTAAGLLAVAIVVLGGLAPLLSGAQRAEERAADKQELLEEIGDFAARLGPQAGAVVDSDEQSLVVIVDRTTRSRGLATFLKRNQPDGDQRIRLRFENAPFDSLVEWLVELRRAHALSALSVNIDSAAEPGRINCTMVLGRAGA